MAFLFKPKGSKIWRGRHKFGDGTKWDVSLKTKYKHVAEANFRQMVREHEEELAGLLAPKVMRDAAAKPLAEMAEEFLRDLEAAARDKDYIRILRLRLKKLIAECSWKLLRDVTAESFLRWRGHQRTSPKTLNEYLNAISGLLNWLEAAGRVGVNPLRHVPRCEVKGQERVKRRALTRGQLANLCSHPKRGLVYQFAAFTGLRRAEIRALNWDDISFDAGTVRVRASTSKNKEAVALPLHPELLAALQFFKESLRVARRQVFRSVPEISTLRRDLARLGIPYVDEQGRKADFHALRHTFCTLLALSGVSPRSAMELMRHSEMRLTQKVYTDAGQLSVAADVAKILPLHLPHKGAQSGQNGL